MVDPTHGALNFVPIVCDLAGIGLSVAMAHNHNLLTGVLFCLAFIIILVFYIYKVPRPRLCSLGIHRYVCVHGLMYLVDYERVIDHMIFTEHYKCTRCGKLETKRGSVEI